MLSPRARILAGVIVVVAGGLSAVAGRSGSAATSFSFAVVGDLPYSPADVAAMGDLVADINNDTDVEFVAHAGDVKPGALTCSDSVMQARFDLFQGFQDPFWFTPGDNDWTGCWQAGAPPYASPYDPQERLTALRALFYPTPTRSTGGTTMAVTPQSASPGFAAYVENVRFRHDCVTFGSIHLVGSTNGLDPVPGETTAQKNAREAEVADRVAADVAWIDQIFDSAEAVDSKGVLLLMHERPTTEQGVGTVAVKNRLVARATAPAWAGKPVILVNGSEHEYQVVEGFLGVPNLTRWVTFGEDEAIQKWLKTDVDCSSASVFSHVIVVTGTTPPTTVPRATHINDPARVDVQPERGNSILIP